MNGVNWMKGCQARSNSRTVEILNFLNWGREMSAIPAVYENGVFRPTEPTQLPEGTRVIVETEDSATERIQAARRRVFESLSRSYDAGDPGNVLETHNDNQP